MTPKLPLHLLALLLAGSTAARAQAGPEAETTRLFAEGKAQVEANCADCMGSRADALAAGLATLRQALDLGYPDRAAGFRLLAEGWGNLAWGLLDPDEPGQREAVVAQREAYERWLEVEPQSTAALFGYAVTFRNVERRRAVLERLLAVDPGHVDGLAALGLLELDEGETEAGLKHLEKAFDGARYEQAEELGQRLLDAYQEHGEVEGARAVRARLAEIRAELRRIERGEEPPA